VKSAPSACTPAHGPTSHVSIRARSSKRSKQCQNTMTHLRARLRIPDLHGVVKRPADDVLAVRRVRYRVNGARVPRQRALLPTATVRPNRYRAWPGPVALTSLPLATSQTLTVLSLSNRSPDALTTRVPSGENATEFTTAECPVSVHSCSSTKHGGQNTPRSKRQGDDKLGNSPPCPSENPRPSRYCPPPH